jgi:predicted ABC-type ATPase
MAIDRVADRVRRGGHHVPEETVRRRYHRGIGNFFTLYRAHADEWRVYDNSQPQQPALIAKGHGIIDGVVMVDRWEQFQLLGTKSNEKGSEAD